MFKKHKYKFLAVLVLFIVLGGAAYYFKNKGADKKAEKMTEKEEAIQEQPKEPLAVKDPIKKPIKKQDQAVTTKQILVKEAPKPLQLKAK
ncbi:hypothetical protein [Aureispira sp. CCB-QB1]|uniref:hypothetical protein n=1 Tax=Aureispira sp. CCB-QB1 TaxID=1313421 RepID=UPI000698EC20|nr:hypothetical protein [Aureispira sp. CCB-QB1]